MFFRKTERKKINIGAILAIGALAAIGAATVVKCSKQTVNDMACKVKTLFRKEKCDCPGQEEA